MGFCKLKYWYEKITQSSSRELISWAQLIIYYTVVNMKKFKKKIRVYTVKNSINSPPHPKPLGQTSKVE